MRGNGENWWGKRGHKSILKDRSLYPIYEITHCGAVN